MGRFILPTISGYSHGFFNGMQLVSVLLNNAIAPEYDCIRATYCTKMALRAEELYTFLMSSVER